jgi:hypothetical protein
MRLSVVVSVLAAACVAGCGTVTTAGGDSLNVGSEDFRAYVERVFREQNRVATELAFVLFDDPGLDAAEAARLEAADERLLEACAELNELAARRRDGQPLGPARGARAARRAPACEAAALAARAALESLAR